MRLLWLILLLQEKKKVDNQLESHVCGFCKKEFKRSKASLESKLYCSKECAEAQERLKRELKEDSSTSIVSKEGAIQSDPPPPSENTNQSSTVQEVGAGNQAESDQSKTGISSDEAGNYQAPPAIEKAETNQTSNLKGT